MEYQTLSPNIGVKSVDETVQFYTETLGFNLIMSVPAPTGSLQWAMVANGEATLMFQEMGNLADYGTDEFAIFDNNKHILTITEDTVD